MARFLVQMGGHQIGFWDCIAQKIDDRHVTQNDLSKIRDLVLQGSPWVPDVLSWHALAGSLFGQRPAVSG